MGNTLGKIMQFYNETAKCNTRDMNVSQNRNLQTPQLSYVTLEDGSRRKQGGNQEKMCQTCEDWIDLGANEHGDAALVNHEGQKCCMANVKRENHLRSAQQAADALKEIWQNGAGSLHGQ